MTDLTPIPLDLNVPLLAILLLGTFASAAALAPLVVELLGPGKGGPDVRQRRREPVAEHWTVEFRSDEPRSAGRLQPGTGSAAALELSRIARSRGALPGRILISDDELARSSAVVAWARWSRVDIVQAKKRDLPDLLRGPGERVEACDSTG